MGKWLPFNEDGSQHECKANGNNKKTSKTVPNNGNEDLSLEVVLKKLESIGITLDLQKLRNATNGALK